MNVRVWCVYGLRGRETNLENQLELVEETERVFDGRNVIETLIDELLQRP